MAERPTEVDPTEARKAEHIAISIANDVEANVSAGWNDVVLVHRCLPEIDRDSIDTSTLLLGKRLRAPLVIAALTGGTAQAEQINRRLARAAQRFGLAMGVGSQRAYLQREDLAGSYAIVREEAPDALLIADISAPQLVSQNGLPAYTPADVRRAAELIRADAIAIHLNFLQEAVQLEGNTRTAGCARAIERLVQETELPVIAKETGGGIAREQALLLRDLGVAALDVGGAGGTSMPVIESVRSAARGEHRLERMGQLFAGWGIPTAVSLLECASSGLPLIATGGVRSGLDGAKALALGATAAGVALPLLKAAQESYDRVEEWLGSFLEELRTAMFLAGAESTGMMRVQDPLLFGRVLQWAEQRDLRPFPGSRQQHQTSC